MSKTKPIKKLLIANPKKVAFDKAYDELVKLKESGSGDKILMKAVSMKKQFRGSLSEFDQEKVVNLKTWFLEEDEKRLKKIRSEFKLGQ